MCEPLYRITIRKASDFLLLEHAVRKLLNCHNCNFFQSAAYAQLRLAVLQSSAATPVLPIATSPFVMELAADGCTISVNLLQASPLYHDDASSSCQPMNNKKRPQDTNSSYAHALLSTLRQKANDPTKKS